MKKKMELKNLRIRSFVTNLDTESSATVKGGATDGCFTRVTYCDNCEIETDNCGGGSATTAGPGTTNTGWPPSQGCSNNSCIVCHAE